MKRFLVASASGASSSGGGGGGGDDDDGSAASSSGDESSDYDDADAEPTVFFRQESAPEYLMARLNDYAVQGKLRSSRALDLVAAVRESLDGINELLLAYRPPLKSRASEWESKRKLFELALASANPAVEVGKLLPFKL